MRTPGTSIAQFLTLLLFAAPAAWGKSAVEAWTGAAGDQQWGNPTNGSQRMIPDANTVVVLPAASKIHVPVEAQIKGLETSGRVAAPVELIGLGRLRTESIKTSDGPLAIISCQLEPRGWLQIQGDLQGPEEGKRRLLRASRPPAASQYEKGASLKLPERRVA